MKTIATLDLSVRLVVFQFLMKSAQVPRIVSLKRDSDTPPLPPVPGVEVLKSTPKLNIFPLVIKVAAGGRNYELVDVWQNPHETKWDMSFVRFVFCNKEHVKQDKLHSDFKIKRSEFTEVFCALTDKNLWATQGHLNPYFENGKPTDQKVLMLGCAGRIPNSEVFSGGRDENNRGIGPKVLLSRMSSSLDLKLTTNEVVLKFTTPIPETASAI